MQLGFGLQVVATARTAGARRSATAEQPTEKVADVRATRATGSVEQIVEVELSAVGAVAGPGEATAEVATVESATESASGKQPTSFVVLLALSRIRQYFLGLGDGLVPIFGRLVPGVAVGVILGEQLAGHPLDLVLAGVRRDAQLLVEVLFDPFALGHIASPPACLSLASGGCPCPVRTCRYLSDGSDSALCSPSFASLSTVSTVSDLAAPSVPASAVESSGMVSTTPTSACRKTWSPSL